MLSKHLGQLISSMKIDLFLMLVVTIIALFVAIGLDQEWFIYM